MVVRPIDANIAMKKIREYMEDFPNAHTRLAACRVILSMLGDENQIPTLTPPTVGRCKDCDNWDEDLSAGRKRMNNYVCCCQEWSDFEDGRCRYTRPNDYCSYFEQREALKNGKTD